MRFRALGKTGLETSLLGFGAMRLPEDTDEAVAVLHRAFDLGVNFLDTARGYGMSEAKCGKALRGRRENVILSTKNPCWEDQTADGWWRRLEESLTALDTPYIDVYTIWHALSWESCETHLLGGAKLLREAHKARDQGLIRHIGFSFHDSPENLLRIIDTGEFESMIVQYNLLDRGNEEGIARAAERGMGVIVMGPVGGGRLAGLSPELARMVPGGVASTPEAALRFVFANPAVSTAISGMGSLAMVEENVATACRDEPIADAEREAMRAALDEAQRFAQLYCTGCRYCMPCPHGVNIPRCFSLMNYHRVYGLTETARREYGRMPAERPEGSDEAKLNAAACIRCGECEPKCPQRIPIIAQLAETHAALGS